MLEGVNGPDFPTTRWRMPTSTETSLVHRNLQLALNESLKRAHSRQSTYSDCGLKAIADFLGFVEGSHGKTWCPYFLMWRSPAFFTTSYAAGS